eukprot:TRINITY_DN63633_c0_g1_i1.p1 TRINITY_DN63633_c0_g1~~TRINITY_DN63633_c0_g1_i1.p1  ORF type:complete len:566 (+),score=99.09 TRINITY_DN63633_c0_g1_i1:44-1741(+)
MSAPGSARGLWLPPPFPLAQAQDASSEVSSVRAPSAVSSARTSRRERISPRDPRAYPYSGASKEHEQLHRKFHDDAAGARDSWWLRQRDVANDYTRANGVLTAGPALVVSLPAGQDGRSQQVTHKLQHAFQNAAGTRTETVGRLEPRKQRAGPPVGAAVQYASQVDEIVFHHDIDRSLEMKDAAGHRAAPRSEVVRRTPLDRISEVGAILRNADKSSDRTTKNRDREHVDAAAGRESVERKPHNKGLKQYPVHGVLEADAVVQGRDISHSAERVKEHLGMDIYKGAAGEKSLGRSPRVRGLRPSPGVDTVCQVDEVLTGRDVDHSAEAIAARMNSKEFEGAAGRKYVGAAERKEGLKVHPAREVCEVDEVVFGHDSDASKRRVAEAVKMKEYQDAAGERSIGRVRRKEGLKPDMASRISHVDEVVFGADLDNSAERSKAHLESPQFQGAAGQRCLEKQERKSGVRANTIGRVTDVDEIVFGHDIDKSKLRVQEHLQSPQWQGAAGQKRIGAAARAEGKQVVPGSNLSQVDEIVLGRDIDKSADRRGAPEKARRRRIGLTSERSYR